MSEFHVHPGRAYIEYQGSKFWKDGVLYGAILPEAEVVEERPMPTLWSTVVIHYRSKAQYVEAIQLTPSNVQEVAEWCGGMVVEEIDPQDNSKLVALNIPTLEGPVRASENDFVIKGSGGQFSTMHPNAFDRRFEVL
jgi:hypothetical protein